MDDHGQEEFIRRRTGEIFNLAPPPRTQGKGVDFYMFTQDASVAVALEPQFQGAGEYKVYCLLLGRFDYENKVTVNVTAIARELNLSRQTVSVALGRLVSHGYLERQARDGRNYIYSLPVDKAWRGQHGKKAATRRAEQRGWSVHDGGIDTKEQGA